MNRTRTCASSELVSRLFREPPLVFFFVFLLSVFIVLVIRLDVNSVLYVRERDQHVARSSVPGHVLLPLERPSYDFRVYQLGRHYFRSLRVSPTRVARVFPRRASL